MDRLLAYLDRLPSGEVPDIAQIQALLSESLSDLQSLHEGSPPHGKIEHVVWTRPILGFAIRKSRGRPKAAYQKRLEYWSVDLESRTIERTGRAGSRIRLNLACPRRAKKQVPS
jgi:hypothetical protein